MASTHISIVQTQAKGQARHSSSLPELAVLLGPQAPAAPLVLAPASATHQDALRRWQLCCVCIAVPAMPQPTWYICWHRHIR